MSCQRTRERLGPYLDDELPPALRRAVEAHVDECESCAEELARLEAVASALAENADDDPPAGLWSAIENRLDLANRSAARYDRLQIRFGGWAVAAVIALSLGAGLIGLNRFDRSGGRAEAAAIDFSVMLDALPINAERAFHKFLLLYQGRRILPYEAPSFAPRLNFAIPDELPCGFSLQEVYALRFGDDDGIAARYARQGEMLLAVFHPPVHEDAYGTYNDLPCVIGRHRGHKVQVGDWKLVHLTDPTTCHCVLSRLDEGTELPAVMASVAPGPSRSEKGSPPPDQHAH